MFKNEKYLVTDHNYMNTGGGCMVSIFTVYNHKDNNVSYIVANEEGFNIQTVDTISCEFADFSEEQMKAIVVGSFDWSALTCEPAPWDMLFEDEEWKLYKYCQFEFYKRDCQRFKTKISIPGNWLTTEMYDRLSNMARIWLSENDVEVKTDGENVWLPEAFNDYMEEVLNKKLQAIKDFKQWFDGLIGADQPEEDIERIYNEDITLTFNGRSVTLDFDADNYTSVSDLLQRAIDNF